MRPLVRGVFAPLCWACCARRSAALRCQLAGKSSIPEASGKTTIALHLIAKVQQTGGIAAFIDAEHALDPGVGKDSCKISGDYG
jgi:recA bacterial DNA recombination protein